MRVRPISVTIVAWLFVVVGVVGLVRDALELLEDSSAAFDVHAASASASHLAALVGGAFLLSGRAWARWLLVAWMAFFLVLSAMHGFTQLLVHCGIFAPILFVLFLPRASAFFRRDPAAGTPG